MPMDQHYFTESWKDVQGCGGVQDLPYSVQGWGSGHSSPSASSQPNGSVDKELYRSLVEMIPLVESFMDQRGNKSFSHRASPIYTPTPRDWSSRKKELADLRSLLAKAEEDAKASNQKSQKVEEELEGLQRQIAAFILFFDAAEKAAANSDVQGMNSSEDLEVDPNFSIPDSDANGLCKESAEEDHNGFCQLDETEVQDIEQARRKYLAAVIAAKNNPGEESMSLAADLRLQLQQFLLRPALANALDDQLSVQVLGFTAA